ncbi:hypothetical protein CGRA01v4_03245 [Colletotrichum graminicola]|nr:hypothetical protein CGRA01v4_03245 [Colletotrichum graminicola]
MQVLGIVSPFKDVQTSTPAHGWDFAGPQWTITPPLAHPLSDSRHPAGCDVSSLAATPKRPWLGSVGHLSSSLLHVLLFCLVHLQIQVALAARRPLTKRRALRWTEPPH